MSYSLTSCSEGKTITISLFLPLLRCASSLAPGLKGSPGASEREMFCQRISMATFLHLPSTLLLCFLCCSAHTLWMITHVWVTYGADSCSHGIQPWSLMLETSIFYFTPPFALRFLNSFFFFGPVEIFEKILLLFTSTSNKWNYSFLFWIADLLFLQPSVICSFLCSGIKCCDESTR